MMTNFSQFLCVIDRGSVGLKIDFFKLNLSTILSNVKVDNRCQNILEFFLYLRDNEGDNIAFAQSNIRLNG